MEQAKDFYLILYIFVLFFFTIIFHSSHLDSFTLLYHNFNKYVLSYILIIIFTRNNVVTFSLFLLAYCTTGSSEPSLLTQCSTLTSDATLISLFRSNAAPLPCPIKGPLEFTYSQGEGECNWPRSRAEACTQDSRLLLRYQACANVHSSESVGQYSPRVITTVLTCDKFILHERARYQR